MTARNKSWRYVYIIQSLERYKIGWSGDLKTIQRRFNRLNLMNAYGITLVLIIRSRRSHKIKSELHNQFADKRIHGEWFCLDQSDLDIIREQHFRNIYSANELGITYAI